MNCKPGDLAVIVNVPYPNEWAIGRIVRVTRSFEFAGEWYWRYEGNRLKSPRTGSIANEVEDYFLRPLRPGDGEDEMLRIVGKPQEVAA